MITKLDLSLARRLRLGPRAIDRKSPINGASFFTFFANPAVNGWAKVNLNLQCRRFTEKPREVWALGNLTNESQSKFSGGIEKQTRAFSGALPRSRRMCALPGNVRARCRP